MTTQPDRRGSLNPSWAGDSCSYVSAHRRVYVQWGAASRYECVDCGQQAKDWSYDGLDALDELTDSRGLRYSPNVEYYEPRCTSCHRAFDYRPSKVRSEQMRAWQASRTPEERSAASRKALAVRWGKHE